MSRVEETTSDDAPEANDSMSLRYVQGVVDFIANEQLLGLVVNQTPYDSNHSCTSQSNRITAACDGHDSRDDSVAQVEDVVPLDHAMHLYNLGLVSQVTVLIHGHHRQSG